MKRKGEDVDEDKLFYSIVGGHDKRTRVYGFGCNSKAIPSSRAKTDLYCLPVPNPEVERLKDLVQRKNDEIIALKEMSKAKEEKQNATNNILVDHLQTYVNLLKNTLV